MWQIYIKDWDVVDEFSIWNCAPELWEDKGFGVCGDCWGHQEVWNDTARIVSEGSSNWILFQGLNLIQTEPQ